ncbi:MAG: cyclodeaminase/cyclohydrolase family protein [Candidatus Woesebacteria bacterium]|nr:cyclodeaminase/cyclohydrolase family protein [Candidatus Woesebacteria bacterium]
MKIQDQKIEDFLDSVASKAPTPGGGAVAALTGAMAASLVEKVCNLTIGKKNYSGVQTDMVQMAERASELSEKLLDLSDRDCLAFEKVMEAMKSGDKDKIKGTLLTAIEIPEKTAEYCENVRELAEIAAKLGNVNARSDAMSAEHLAFAAIQSAQENIEINKKMLAKLQG